MIKKLTIKATKFVDEAGEEITYYTTDREKPKSLKQVPFLVPFCLSMAAFVAATASLIIAIIGG